MGVVEVDISMSVDGFITGPPVEGNPAGLGQGGEILHAWVWQDPDRRRLLDDALFATSGAVITSRKVYNGTGGWGDDGFYRMPVFVLTHRPHDVLIKGETTFTFVTDGIESAIAKARLAAGDKKVHVMGGATVVQQAVSSTAFTSTLRQSFWVGVRGCSTTSQARYSWSEPRWQSRNLPRTSDSGW